MTTVAIQLNDEHQRFLRGAVKTGDFVTESEVVATALDILKSREEKRRMWHAERKRELEKGIADLDNGRTVDFNLDEFLAEMNAKKPARNP